MIHDEPTDFDDEQIKTALRYKMKRAGSGLEPDPRSGVGYKEFQAADGSIIQFIAVRLRKKKTDETPSFLDRP